MQLPSANTPVATCGDLSVFTWSMLAKFPERVALTGLGTKVLGAADALLAAEQAYKAGSRALVTARVGVRHADLMADQGVRLTLKAVQLADGQSGKKVTPQLFPNGVTPIVRPIGSAEVAELRDLEGRLDALSGAWADAASEKAKIVALRTTYEAAIGTRRNAQQSLSDLRAARDAAREDFLDVYAEVAARVKAEFPRDRVMQDLFFDTVRVDHAADTSDAEPVPAPEPAPTPVASGAKQPN